MSWYIERGTHLSVNMDLYIQLYTQMYHFNVPRQIKIKCPWLPLKLFFSHSLYFRKWNSHFLGSKTKNRGVTVLTFLFFFLYQPSNPLANSVGLWSVYVKNMATCHFTYPFQAVIISFLEACERCNWSARLHTCSPAASSHQRIQHEKLSPMLL